METKEITKTALVDSYLKHEILADGHNRIPIHKNKELFAIETDSIFEVYKVIDNKAVKQDLIYKIKE